MGEIKQSGVLPKLNTVLEEENIFKHTCGSYAFFAWGIKLISKESVGKHRRLQNMSGDSEVMICAQCLDAVVMLAGDMFDASDYIGRDEVDKILMYGQARTQATPLKAMDI